MNTQNKFADAYARVLKQAERLANRQAKVIVVRTKTATDLHRAYEQLINKTARGGAKAR